MATPLNPPLALTAKGYEKTFDTMEGVRDFALEEVKVWEAFVAKVNPGTPWFIAAISEQRSISSSLRDAAINGIINYTSPTLGGNLPAVVALLQRFSTPTNPSVLRVICSRDEEGQYILNLASMDAQLACSVLVSAQGMLFQQGWQTAGSFWSDLPLLIQGQAIYSNLRIKIDHARGLREIENQLTSLHDSKSKELAALKATYTEQLWVTEHVQRWRHKWRWHLGTAIASAILFLGVGVGGLVLIDKHFETIKTLVAGQTPNYTALIVLVGVPAFLALWVMRLLSRIFLTNVGLMTDASEKRIMTDAYLALHKDGNLTDADRLLFMQAIFARSSIPAQDDAAPPTPFSEVAKLLTGGRGPGG